MLCTKFQLLSLLNKLIGRSKWRVARVSGEKSQNKGDNVGKDKISTQPLEDSPPWHHSPMMDHYQNHIHFPICNEWTKIVLPTCDAKIVGLKPCNLSDILHILTKLEYTLLIIPHPKGYYFIHHLQTCLSIDSLHLCSMPKSSLKILNICGRYRMGISWVHNI